MIITIIQLITSSTITILLFFYLVLLIYFIQVSLWKGLNDKRNSREFINHIIVELSKSNYSEGFFLTVMESTPYIIYYHDCLIYSNCPSYHDQLLTSLCQPILQDCT